MSEKHINGQLAALAVFRDLYSRQTDVYGVIKVILEDLIAQHAMRSFTTTQINALLKSTYEFEMPDAVINPALNRIANISKTGSTWVVAHLPNSNSDIAAKRQEINSAHATIKQQLIDFVQRNSPGALSEKDISSLLEAFGAFLLDEKSNEKALAQITAFIIANENTPNFRDTLNQIREGVILYSGLRHSSNLNEIGAWKERLVLILDTEILFNLAGYNGELGKKWFMEMFRFIQQVNAKQNERKFMFRYFPNVKKEIEGFFYAAEKIVEDGTANDPSKVAMQSIINGCKNGADVIEKKAKFYDLIKSYLIEEISFESKSDEETHKYWIYDRESIDRFKQDPDLIDKPIEEYVSILNSVAVLRKNKIVKSLENAEYVLVTGKSAILHISHGHDFREPGAIPLAVSINYMTSRLWFKLNRGFGEGKFPTSFDVIAKAQMSLAMCVGESLHELYNQYREKVKNGELTGEAAALILTMFRKLNRKPEDINSENALHELEIINATDVSIFAEKYDHAIETAKETEKQNQELKSLIWNCGIPAKQKWLRIISHF